MRVAAHKYVLWPMYACALVVIAVLAWRGSSYYSTPLPERPHHPDFWDLKPGGSLGHLVGVVGSSLMVIMLLYSVRKRSRLLRKAGPISAWLDFHIFCGIIGPLLVILHTSFKVGGLVALSFWSMIAVALSGVAGRYIYVQIPRRRNGDELTLAEVREQSEALAAELRDRYGVAPDTIAALDRETTTALSRDTPMVELLWMLLVERMRVRAQVRRFLATHRELGTAHDLAPLLERRAYLQRRVILSSRIQQVFHYWHVFHKPFAVVMYLFMIVHIAVVMLTGYGWSR